jgi:hypothetical protein
MSLEDLCLINLKEAATSASVSEYSLGRIYLKPCRGGYVCNRWQSTPTGKFIVPDGIYKGCISYEPNGKQKTRRQILYYAVYDSKVEQLSRKQLDRLFRGRKSADQVLRHLREKHDRKYVDIGIISTDIISVERKLFQKAEKVFLDNGYTLESGVEAYIRRCVTHGVPFSDEEIAGFKAEMKRSAGAKAKAGSLEALFKDYHEVPFKTELQNPEHPTGNELW